MSTAWGERLDMLHEARKQISVLPCDALFELPGRPNVVWSLKNYTPDKVAGAQECRSDMPFLFKAFETGQIGPRRLSRLVGDKPRNATIHEYLDWTVTGVEAKAEGEYDFSGFRLLVLLQRERVMWPAPGQYDKPEPKKHPLLGAPLDPLPALQVKGKPLSAATIRTGPDYIEIPFVATHENKRGRGFGRCVVEAVEEIARALNINKLLLCSTCEASVANTWRHLGFKETSEDQLKAWDVEDSDLVHMQNTLQMHKEVPLPRAWKPLRIKHQAFVARVYMPADKQTLSSRTQPAWPGRHDMGAVSGFRSSRATSAVTAGSLSNASYGNAEGVAVSQQQNGDIEASPAAAAVNGAAGGAGAGIPGAGGDQDMQQEQQSRLQAAVAPATPEQQPAEDQQQATQQLLDQMQQDDNMLIDIPGCHHIANLYQQPQQHLEQQGHLNGLNTAGAGLIQQPLHLEQQQQQQEQDPQVGGDLVGVVAMEADGGG